MAKKLEPLIYCGRSEIYGQIENELEHIVYDLSIEDLDERKRKAQVFENAVRVADFLKVKVDVVFKNRVAPKRIKGVDGRNYAVRVLNKNQK